MKSKNLKSKKIMALVGIICLALVSIIAIDKGRNDRVMIIGGEVEPIKAMITEIDRENFTMKVEPLENNELLNTDVTLHTKFTTFTNGGKESAISNFSVGYLVDVYVKAITKHNL